MTCEDALRNCGTVQAFCKLLSNLVIREGFLWMRLLDSGNRQFTNGSRQTQASFESPLRPSLPQKFEVLGLCLGMCIAHAA
jgi:hypothetical protein